MEGSEATHIINKKPNQGILLKPLIFYVTLKKETNVCVCFALEKVQMQGTAVGRAVDLTLLRSYDELISELEKMFEIEGELRTKDKWTIVFTDDEGDMMLVGDDPWK